MSAAILLVKWGLFPVSLSCTTRGILKTDLFLMKLVCSAGGGVHSEQRLKALELLTFCVSSLIFILFLSSCSGKDRQAVTVVVVSKLCSPILLILGEFCSEIDDHKIYTFSTFVYNVLASSQFIFIVQ